MKNELITCRCDRLLRPCTALATQEDLLCDTCRRRTCCWLSTGEGGGVHLRIWSIDDIRTPG